MLDQIGVSYLTTNLISDNKCFQKTVVRIKLSQRVSSGSSVCPCGNQNVASKIRNIMKIKCQLSSSTN